MAYIFEEADKLRNQGQSLEAAKIYQEIAESSDDQTIIGSALHMAAVSLNQSGDHKGSEELFNKAREHYAKVEDKLNSARVARDYGTCLLNQEEFSKAEQVLLASIDDLSDLDEPGELAMSQAKLAVVLAKLNRSEEASSQAGDAVLNANKSENTFYIATAYQEAARVEFLNKNFEAMLAPLYSALGALKLESDPHAKRHAELLLSLNKTYRELSNQVLASKTLELAEAYLQELDEQTANRIRGYFQD